MAKKALSNSLKALQVGAFHSVESYMFVCVCMCMWVHTICVCVSYVHMCLRAYGPFQ